MQRSKRYTAVYTKVDRRRLYGIEEAIALLKETANAKFDETAEAAFKLSVNPQKNEHRIRGAVSLPHGLGKTVKVLAFAKGEKLKEAQEAGADYIGGEDLVKKIEGGWLDFDKVVATPDIMNVVSKLGRILGPRGLMPSPKTGTVTPDIGQAVSEIKRGRLEFKLDEYGNIQSPFGRCSLAKEALIENFVALAAGIFSEKPSDIKGRFFRGVTVSSTMGPGIKLDPDAVTRAITARAL